MRRGEIKIYQQCKRYRWKDLCLVGRRGDGSICVALMRERRQESERKKVAVCICLIYHSPAVLCSGSFEAHCLSHLVRGLPAVSVYVFVNEDEGGVY